MAQYPIELITNKFGLPEEVCKAIIKDRYANEEENPSDYSATKLIAPVQQTILTERYPDRLRVFDVSDFFWSFVGSIAHTVLEEAWHESMGSRIEERLYTLVRGVMISGKLDCYKNGEIRDYKSTKVYKILKGDYSDWEKQLNIYAFLCKRNKRPVSRLQIVALILDWKEFEKARDKNYPDCPIKEIAIKMWSDQEQEDYVEYRVALLEKSKMLPDDQLPECTDKEMWCDTKDFAVIKDGAKRASRVFDTFDEALNYRREIRSKTLNTKPDEAHLYDIVERKTERTRCMRYCAASTVCHQHRKYLAERNVDGEQLQEDIVF